ncbi:MAG TPA: hypothetical protein PLW77_09265 [Bacteroidales bacterium]|nr:hypothetical protein [Bacteroidales bacterium]
MKTFLKFLLLSITLFLNSGCNKYEICSNIPEGLYEGWFTDEGANPLYLLMNVFVIDDNTLIINSSNNPSFGSFVKRNKYSIGGAIEGKSCLGKIHRKNGKYIILGNYSYFGYNGGLGNPNRQYYEINGTFEIQSN